MYQRIQGPDLELRDGEGLHGVRVDVDSGCERLEGIVVVVRGCDGGGEGDEDVFRLFGHGERIILG